MIIESKPKKCLDINKVIAFKDLEKEIIKSNKCCACGACIAFCESQSFNVIKMNEYIPKLKSDENGRNCTECSICYFICPQTSTLLKELNDAHWVEDEIGHVIKILAAKTTDESIEKVGQCGGIVSTILTYLFEKHKIDAAIVSEFDKEFEPIPKIIFDKQDILKSAGTRFSISPQILPLKNIYNISLDIIAKKGLFDIDQLRVAFVGTPCQCRAVSKMKFLHIKPAHVVKFLISLFCYECFNYSQFFDILRRQIKVDPSNIKKLWIKKDLFIKTKNNEEFKINIKKLNPAVRNSCYKCDDFTGRFSDISIGSSGAQKGYSMIIIRTESGDKIIRSILSNRMIEQFINPADLSDNWKTKKLNLFKKIIDSKTKELKTIKIANN